MDIKFFTTIEFEIFGKKALNILLVADDQTSIKNNEYIYFATNLLYKLKQLGKEHNLQMSIIQKTKVMNGRFSIRSKIVLNDPSVHISSM